MQNTICLSEYLRNTLDGKQDAEQDFTLFFPFNEIHCLLRGRKHREMISLSLGMKNRFVEIQARQSKRSNCEVEVSFRERQWRDYKSRRKVSAMSHCYSLLEVNRRRRSRRE